MDLVTRLRSYIDHIAMPVTQFADTCGIPRPSMSQLLSGRNKKVSNELISKIHDAFPELNVLWLMFGQGEMLVKEKKPFSEPQNSAFADDFIQQSANSQNVGKTILDFGVIHDSEPEKLQQRDSNLSASGNQSIGDVSVDPHIEPSSAPLSDTMSKAGPASGVQSLAVQADRTKRIVNIIVYYSDNSFEAFVPEQSNALS